MSCSGVQPLRSSRWTRSFERKGEGAISIAAAQCCGLPAHADRNEILSQVFRLTWEACLRIDWTRYPAWPVFLEAQGKVSALLEELVTVSAETKYVETK